MAYTANRWWHRASRIPGSGGCAARSMIKSIGPCTGLWIKQARGETGKANCSGGWADIVGPPAVCQRATAPDALDPKPGHNSLMSSAGNSKQWWTILDCTRGCLCAYYTPCWPSTWSQGCVPGVWLVWSPRYVRGRPCVYLHGTLHVCTVAAEGTGRVSGGQGCGWIAGASERVNVCNSVCHSRRPPSCM